MGVEASVVAIDGVTRRYRARGKPDRVAVDAVSLSIGAGAWCALLGPNGSGKSTLLRMLAGLDEPDAGALRVLDAPAGSGAATARMGVVFQRPSLDPLLTVRENLRAQGSLFGLVGAEARARAEAYAARLGVADRLDDRVRTLSGGLARRADLARALINEPELLLLDEPTSGLDLSARRSFLDAIGALHEASMTIVMTTHDMMEAERSSRVVMLDAGRVVADDTPAALRSACGGRVVRCDVRSDGDVAERILRDMGLEVQRADGFVRAAMSDGEGQAEEVASRLARAGVAFECGPPTLGDAYLAMTGRALDVEGGS